MRWARAKRMPFRPTSTRKKTARSWRMSSRSGRTVSSWFPPLNEARGSCVVFCIRGNYIRSMRLTSNVFFFFHPELHILVNNSGSNWGAPYDEYPSSAWTRVLTLNLHRVFDITRMLTPLLENGASVQDPSRIINIGSVDGLRVPALETFAYSASKAGLHHLSRVLANHLGKRNITYVFSSFLLGLFIRGRC